MSSKDTQFKSEGKGVAAKSSKAIGVRFPVETIEALEGVGNKQEYIRACVRKQLELDGLLILSEKNKK